MAEKGIKVSKILHLLLIIFLVINKIYIGLYNFA